MSNIVKNTSSFHSYLMYLMKGTHDEYIFVRRSKPIKYKSCNDKAVINENNVNEFKVFEK